MKTNEPIIYIPSTTTMTPVYILMNVLDDVFVTLDDSVPGGKVTIKPIIGVFKTPELAEEWRDKNNLNAIIVKYHIIDELGYVERKPISGRYPWDQTSESNEKDKTK